VGTQEVKMNRTWTLALVAALVATPAFASDSRTLSDSFSAAGLERVFLDIGVGDVVVTGTDGDTVDVEVILTARRGGIFSSKRRAEREIQEATLDSYVGDSKLNLSIDSPSSDRRFEEEWHVELPGRLLVKMDVGVGDVSIRHIAGGVHMECGVGDILIEAEGGEISVEAGVGEITVRAPADAYGHVECAAGVGDARLIVRGDKIGGGGFIGDEVKWNGNGDATIEIEVGVGDATIRLD
jgi:hypothetical protein